MKRLLILFLFLMFSLATPSAYLRVCYILASPPIKPFDKLIHAIGMVETKGDTLAYNRTERAVGFFQIRPIRIRDYNRRTGNHYKLKDMYNYEIAEKVFLYYAYHIGPYNFEKIARSWNGSGKKTIEYWKKIKKVLLNE